MNRYEAIDRRRQQMMEWGLFSFTVAFCALALVTVAWASGQAYHLITDPPTYCVPSNPRI
ncbi:MAG: hypothetical protein ACR2QF_07000 [Geminicoccaceae bacterium]